MSEKTSEPNGFRLKVLFIAGLGRSGSTLLGRMLAQSQGFAVVGEIAHIWERGFVQNVRCGCGTAFRACPFWQAVLEKACGGIDQLAPATLHQLRAIWQWRRSPLFAAPRLWMARYRDGLDLYATHTAKLLGAVASLTGAQVIVDTSKTPAHLVALARVPQIQTHVVHLVRDSRAVAYSWQQKKGRLDGLRTDVEWPPANPLKTALLWNATNILVWFVRRHATTYRLVRYEDLMREPRRLLEEIVREIATPPFPYERVDQPGPGVSSLAPELKSPLPALPRGEDEGEGLRPGSACALRAYAADSSLNPHPRPLPRVMRAREIDLDVHHTVAGNPIRFQHGPVELSEDAEWEERMPVTTRLAVTALSWPLLRAYGYLPRAGGLEVRSA